MAKKTGFCNLYVECWAFLGWRKKDGVEMGVPEPSRKNILRLFVW